MMKKLRLVPVWWWVLFVGVCIGLAGADSFIDTLWPTITLGFGILLAVENHDRVEQMKNYQQMQHDMLRQMFGGERER